jgi:hypothetical protein
VTGIRANFSWAVAYRRTVRGRKETHLHKIERIFLGMLALLAAGAQAQPPGADAELGRGRHLVATRGCNHCHTAGYMQQNGRAPEAEWLTGDSIGWQGAWGTTYATNLRVLFQHIDEKTWLERAPGDASANADADLRAARREGQDAVFRRHAEKPARGPLIQVRYSALIFT